MRYVLAGGVGPRNLTEYGLAEPLDPVGDAGEFQALLGHRVELALLAGSVAQRRSSSSRMRSSRQN